MARGMKDAKFDEIKPVVKKLLMNLIDPVAAMVVKESTNLSVVKDLLERIGEQIGEQLENPERPPLPCSPSPHSPPPSDASQSLAPMRRGRGRHPGRHRTLPAQVVRRKRPASNGAAVHDIRAPKKQLTTPPSSNLKFDDEVIQVQRPFM